MTSCRRGHRVVVACLAVGIIFGAFLEDGVVIDERDGAELGMGHKHWFKYSA